MIGPDIKGTTLPSHKQLLKTYLGKRKKKNDPVKVWAGQKIK